METQLEVRIVWGDCDEQGIVFYPKYFYWMDSAFQALLRSAGQSVRAMREGFGIVGIPIVEANARFLSSTTHEEILRIEAEIRHWGKTSFRAEYRGFCGDRPIFDGFEARVWLERASNGQPAAAPIPEAFKSAFAALGRPSAQFEPGAVTARARWRRDRQRVRRGWISSDPLRSLNVSISAS